MGFKLKAALQLAGLSLTTLLLGWVVWHTDYRATPIALTLLLCAQVAVLWRTLTTTNRELTRFLDAISHNDFTQSFKPVAGDGGFRELGQAFEAIIERFRQARSDKELQAAYLSAFIERLPTAVLAVGTDGRVPHSNSKLQELLRLPAPPPSLAQIHQHHPQLAEALEQLQAGQSVTLQLKTAGDTRNLKIACTVLCTRGLQQKLLTLHNIQQELDAQELQAWQNLIRVMAHEIMNSITPITSLADTASRCLEDSRALPTTRSDPQLHALLDDVGSALETIGARSQALLRFVDSYRRLSRLPTPMPQTFRMQQLFTRVHQLVERQLGDVQFSVECEPPPLELRVDQEQLEQALLNLLNNALYAVAGQAEARISLRAWQQSGRVHLRVEDNGCGMTPEQLEKIFVPFFTTKRGGNGIGMSIVRQIVHLNGGRIEVQSNPGKGTSVLLSF